MKKFGYLFGWAILLMSAFCFAADDAKKEMEVIVCLLESIGTKNAVTAALSNCYTNESFSGPRAIVKAKVRGPERNVLGRVRKEKPGQRAQIFYPLPKNNRDDDSWIRTGAGIFYFYVIGNKIKRDFEDDNEFQEEGKDVVSIEDEWIQKDGRVLLDLLFDTNGNATFVKSTVKSVSRTIIYEQPKSEDVARELREKQDYSGEYAFQEGGGITIRCSVRTTTKCTGSCAVSFLSSSNSTRSSSLWQVVLKNIVFTGL